MRGAKCIIAAMPTPKKSLYEILGVGRDANTIDIGLAYERRRAELDRRVPPDPSETALVQQAYEVLSNARRRATYDASLVTAAEKAAASEQATDLVLEPEPAPVSRNPIWIGATAGLVVIVAALYFTFRSPSPAAPAKERAAEPPKPVVQAPPPPPKPLPAAAILAGTASSVGVVLSYEMCGHASPIGIAAAIEPGVFITTCHGIRAGAALVVRIGAESHSANLALIDETLDLCKLSVPDLRGRGVPIAPDEPRAGDTIHVLGANAKGEIALTDGKVKQVRAAPNLRVIEITVPIAPNGSGGAVFDAYGRLVGVATTPHGFGAGLNIVLPASAFATMRQR
jgi:hypothetical protein